MRNQAFELQLPLDDGASGEMARNRLAHLRAVGGVDDDVVLRLVRAFPSLRSIYSAREDELERVVGSVAAARIRWFLDAPLDTGLAPLRAAKIRSMPAAA
jgi:ERCC4-type nuclease